MTEHVNLRATYVVEGDPANFCVETDDDEIEEVDGYDFVVINSKCSDAGWTETDVVCRCHSQVEANRIAQLLTEHGIS